MRELKETFYGRAEVKGFIFRQVARTDCAYIYAVMPPGVKKPHYEVFRRKENHYFGVVRYPTANAFGFWAWTYPTLEMAQEKLRDLSPPQNTENLHHVSGVLALEIKM